MCKVEVEEEDRSSNKITKCEMTKKKHYVTQSQPLAFKVVTFTLYWLVSFLCNWYLFFFGGGGALWAKGIV